MGWNKNASPEAKAHVREYMRDYMRRWTSEHPEQWLATQLRSHKRQLEKYGFTVSGGEIDLQTGKPVKDGAGE